jgi:hypothetical protein
MTLLQRLFLFLLVAAEGDDPPADPPPPGPEGTLDDLLDLEESIPASRAATTTEEDEDPKVALQREREERRREKEELERERRARIDAETRAAAARPPAQTTADPEWDAEETRLRDTTISELERWQIQSNRAIRGSNRAAQSAYFQAQDLADKTSFDRLAHTMPKLYNRYQSRVEAAVADMRSKGQNAPREAVLRLFIGDDMVKGLIKPKTKAKAAATETTTTVDRGRTPGARSDVRAKSGNSEREKRRARLENVNI